tara:strand:+ start:457 stop:1614 length:1158 start_codon:yes stop_codon:yes gene_type:complete
MKFIGQFIQNFIARFKSDVYLEDISSGTIASGGNLGLDSNNKIVKATVSSGSGDITGVTLAGDSGSASDTSANVDLTIAGGNAITTSGSSTTVTINHDDTSSQASVNNSGRTFIQDITLDTYGHVTEITSATDADTHVGDITSINITTDEGGGEARAIQASGDADFSILGANGVGVTNSGETITVSSVPAEIDHNSLNNFAANEHFTQANITTVGTIGTGVWQGTAIASAYLDADTAHYSAQRQLTYYMFRADIDTTKTYVGLQEAEGESSTSTNKNLPILTPVAGKLLKVFLRATTDVSSNTFTWRLETQNTSSNTGAAPSVIGTQSGAGCSRQNMATYDFTTSLDSGTNVIGAGDTVQLSIESDSTTANTTYYITCLWEWNLS